MLVELWRQSYDYIDIVEINDIYIHLSQIIFNKLNQTQMLTILKENHLACFDSQKQYICSYTFGIVIPEIKKKQKDKQRDRDKDNKKKEEQLQQIKNNIQLQEQYLINLQIDSEQCYIFNHQMSKYEKKSTGFDYDWVSQYFDMEIKKRDELQFGALPFSLETYLEIYKDPKNWEIALSPKNDEIQLETVLDKDVGKLIIRTYFSNNPFLIPVRIKNSLIQAKKTIKIIVNANQTNSDQTVQISAKKHISEQIFDAELTDQQQIEESIISSADFISKQRVDETDVYLPNKDQKTEKGFYVYTFEASQRVAPEHICIIKGKFYHKELVYKTKTVHLYSGNGRPIEFIHNLEKTIKMLRFVDRDIYIFQNVQTQIESSHRIVFFTDLNTLYSKTFKSYLYDKIYDQWIIEGMVHYNRDNRHFQDCMTELTNLMSEGEQFFPLSQSEYSFDHIWRVKAKFIYHILENLSNNNLTKQILEYSKKKKLTSPMILKKMKDRFGVDKIKTIYEQQFITSTGMNRIFYEMEHQKRQHKLKITLRQKSLICNIFRKYNRYRIKLEEIADLVSPIMERIIAKNQNKKNQMSGPLAVPKILKCLPYFNGSVSVQIENSEPFFQPLQEQNITEKILDQKASLRIKRATGKKNESENSDSISWMMLDSSLVYPAVYKGKNLSEAVIESLVKRVYQSQIEELKVLNSISIKQHSQSASICKVLIEKIKIKSGKEDSKISVKRKILQLLPNFLSKSSDPLIYDEIIGLLYLYEPICYDYSEEGNLFLHSLIQSIGNINYSIKMHQYFQEFHRIFLAISKYHHSMFNQDKFEQLHKQLFKSMMKWLSKYSYKILEEVKDYLELTFNHPRKYLLLIKIMIEEVLGYIDMMGVKESDRSTSLFEKIYSYIDAHAKIDHTGTIRAVLFGYQTRKKQKDSPILAFLQDTFEKLEKIKENEFQAYSLCLDKFKDVLNNSRQKYAFDAQAELLNQNQNYFLAEYLWKQMSSHQSLYNAKIRLAWMKIYRVFYFYFTPIVTMIKLKNNIYTRQFPLDENETNQVLNNVMDFVPDMKWFSIYDSSGHKKKKSEVPNNRKKKKQVQQFNFTTKNLFTVFVAETGKYTWEQLSRYCLDYLKKQYENKQIETGGERFKKIVEKIKETIQKLKRGNMPSNFTYDKMKRKILNTLQDNQEDPEMAASIFSSLERTLREIQELRKKKENEEKGHTSVLIPLNLLSTDMKKNESLD